MSLADRVDSKSEAWRPKDTPEHPNPLIGKIVEVDEGDGDYGVYPILYVQTEDGSEWRWHVFGGVAQGRILKLRPAVGDQIAAKYLGEEDSKNYKGKTYSNWKIVLEKADGKAAGIDYDSMKPEEEDDF